MLGISNGQKYMAIEDVSDSDEEQMDESEHEPEPEPEPEFEPEPDEDRKDLNDKQANGTLADGSATEDVQEPPQKRRAITLDSNAAANGASEPKWSNPDPYTVLPPVDEASRKRKDFVKLIRKARKDVEEASEERNQAAANDDFISFSVDLDEDAAPSSPSVDGRNGTAAGVPGAPLQPRAFSHLQNLHNQQVSGAPGVSTSDKLAHELGPPPGPSQALPNPRPGLSQASPTVPHQVVLDLGVATHQGIPVYVGDENLGNRKRTFDDSIKGNKKGRVTGNGSLLPDWKPTTSMNPVPWLQRTDTITANAGFRSVTSRIIWKHY